MTATVTIKAGDKPVVVNHSQSNFDKSEDGNITTSTSTYTNIKLGAGEERVFSVYKGSNVSVHEAGEYDATGSAVGELGL